MLMRHDTLYGRPNGRGERVPVVLALDDRPGFSTSPRSAFIRAKKLETNYAARLRKIARHIGDIVREFPQGTIEASLLIRTAMEKYARLLEPWADAVGRRMVTEVSQRDEQAWRKVSAQIGRALADEIQHAPVGATMQRLMGEQVSLITSLPIEAAERVHTMTVEGISKGERASSIAARILETGDVTRSRATLIARTEVARTASTLTQSRAEHIGCTHYIWRTAKDSDVRKSHKMLEGKVIAYAEPPECDPGHHAHAGQIWNCRCYQEPVI